MKRSSAVLGAGVLAGLLLGTSGCSTLVKQAYYEVRGAESELLWVQAPAHGALARAHPVEFTPATTSVGPLIAPGLLAAYDAAARQAAVLLATQYADGEQALRIDTDVIYFQRKGLLSGALFLSRLRFVLNGAPAGDALLKVESKAYSAGDEGALAQAALRAVREYLERQRPAPAGAASGARGN